MKPRFIATPAEFRKWLGANHAKARELLVGLHKKSSGKASITWPESIDEALCFGWIDGVRKSVDATSYTIRFTPRQQRSTWSAVNIRRMRELIQMGRVAPAGLQAFEARSDEKSAIYSYEQRKKAQLGGAYERRFRDNPKAWAFFQRQAPWYRRTTTWWVISAKKEETRLKRLDQLIADSARGRRIPLMAGRTKPK